MRKSVSISPTSILVQELQRVQCFAVRIVLLFAANPKLTMAYNNYTLPSGLPVHAVYVNRTDEDGKVTQDRFWGTVKQVGDSTQVYVRIDVDVLQPMLQGLHYG